MMLHQSVLARESTVPRTLRMPHAQPTQVSFVTLDVTVPGTSSADARRALQAALGDDLRLFIVTIDKRNEYTTFRVEVTSHTLDQVIVTLTRTLSQATLGRAAASVVSRPALRDD